MNETIASEPLAEAPDISDKDVARHLDQGLVIIAEGEGEQAYDDFVRERQDRQAHARGDKEFLNDADRTQARTARWAEIERVKAESQAALDAAANQEKFVQASHAYGLENVQDQVQFASIMGKNDALEAVYDRANPGFFDRCKETAEIYGQLAPHVSRAFAQSDYGPQLFDQCNHFPENIQALSRLSPHELQLAVAKAEVHFQHRMAQGQQQQQRPAQRVSAAPPPVKTVGGKSHSNAKSLDDMSYDEYKAARTRQIERSSNRSPRR